MGGRGRHGRSSGRRYCQQLIVASLAELPAQECFNVRVNDVRNCLHWLNRRLGQELTLTAGCRDSVMGSTVVTLLIEGNRAACLWAGDSRCYLWRGQRLFQLTRDHSLQQQWVDEQRMSVEQARAQPGASALTRAIGASEQLTLGMLEFEVYSGDAFLLCSDGLYQEVSADGLGSALSLASPQVALQQLFNTALDSLARDNLTAVVIRQ